MSLPSDIVSPLLAWYAKERRILPWREDPTPYHVWVSEIMLQQTRVETVIDYYHRFLERFPDVFSLAAADRDEVLAYWQGLGYYRRCEALHRGAAAVVSEYGGEIPADFESLLSLPGIGRYTAAAILSIGFGIAAPAVDGNVLRVVTRLMNRDDCIDDERTKRAVEGELREIIPEKEASAFTQALMDLGATVCLPGGAPLCSRCPWETLCAGKERWEELPRRKQKKSRAVEKRTVLLLCHEGAVALRKRPAKGLLANLWEFPNEEGNLTEAEISGRFRGPVAFLGKAKHVFTHREWHMTAFRVDLAEKTEEPGLLWVKKEEIAAYAIPSAFSFIKKEL